SGSPQPTWTRRSPAARTRMPPRTGSGMPEGDRLIAPEERSRRYEFAGPMASWLRVRLPMLDTLPPEIVVRGRHLLSLLFTHWTVLGAGLAMVAWAGARRVRDEAGREALLVVLSLSALAVLGSLS